MSDPRAPRLVKTAKPTPPSESPPVKPPKVRRVTRQQLLNRLSHHDHRMRKLELFEAYLGKDNERWLRRLEVLPYYRAMIDARRVRSRPVSLSRKRWLFAVDPYLAARELFRLEFNQHCESVTWSPDDPQATA